MSALAATTRLATQRGDFGVRVHTPRNTGPAAAHDVQAPVVTAAITNTFVMNTIVTPTVVQPTVLCVHGFPDDASTFDDLGSRLADAGYRSVSLYLRGYSPSPLEGSLSMHELVEDVFAVLDAVSPDAPVHLVAHDYGAQLSYLALARRPERFERAVLLAGAHPAFVVRNARRSLRQLWRSRYIIFFQLGRQADRAVARHNFAAVDRLWRRWSPGFSMPPEHVTRVKTTLAASMPWPVAMYRAGGFDVPEDPVPAPTLCISGQADGCATPFLADGQEALFTNGYRHEVWPGVGHYPHLERPEQTAAAVLDHFQTSPSAADEV